MRSRVLKFSSCWAALATATATAALAVDTPEVPDDVDPKIQLLQTGLKMTMLAEHPDLVTPTGIDVDIDGSIWLISSHTHFRPDAYDDPAHDEILVFDADGSNRRVFYTQTDATMDLELGPGGWVYLAERDRILRVRDSDGDGVGDLEENLATLETEADYPHNGLSGLTWSPGGQLLFSLGENYWKEWTLTGTDGAAVTGTGEGGVFRCLADGKGLERIAKGFWNPFGVCVRDDLEMFVAENDPGARPPCRLIHLVEDGDYGYQRLYGEAPFHPFVAWNGELRGTLPMLDAIGEAPCGILPLGGGLIAPSWSHNRIDFFSIERKGATFGSQRIGLVRGSDTFRPTCIAEGPDGAIYLTDWVYTAYELHKRGRLWKLEIDRGAEWLAPREIEPPNAAAVLAAELRSGKAKVNDEVVLELARGDDPFLARAALRELSRRVDAFPSNWPDEDRANAVYARRLAKPDDETWIRAALADPNRDVRFEALRWIADERLTKFAPNVERMLGRADLDYRLFEACLAAANTLAGDPRAGIADIPMLLARVRNEAAPPKIRAFALRLIPPGDKRITGELLQQLLAAGDPDLTFETARTAAMSDAPMARDLAAQIAGNTGLPPATRAEAILGLARAPGEHVDRLAKLAESGDPTIRDEALRATRTAPVNPGPPALTDTAGWQALIDSAPGEPDLEAGRRLFFHPRLTRCATCHRHNGRGAVVGPDLSAIGAAEGLLESILQPGKAVAPQFFPWQLDLADGSTFIGIALRKGGRSGKEFYRDITGAEVAISKTDIVKREELTISLMPVGLTLNLSPGELRDLLAFLKASGANRG